MSEHLPVRRTLSTSISHWPIWLAVLFFLTALVVYSLQFGGWPLWSHLSESREVWGQFGDFMGGFINPLIALITIWLFTKSLRQNSEMLESARDELEMARHEIARGVEVQQATESALKSQIAIAQAGKDFNAARDLQAKYMDLLLKIKNREIQISVEKLSDAQLRVKFLDRYIEHQYSYLIDAAFRDGFDPAAEYAEMVFYCEQNFKLFACVLQGWVRVSYDDPIEGSKFLFHWKDLNGTVLEIPRYLDKVAFLHMSAQSAIRAIMDIEPGLRHSSIETIPGCYINLP